MSLKNSKEASVAGRGQERQEDEVRELNWLVVGREHARSRKALQAMAEPLGKLAVTCIRLA